MTENNLIILMDNNKKKFKNLPEHNMLNTEKINVEYYSFFGRCLNLETENGKYFQYCSSNPKEFYDTDGYMPGSHITLYTNKCVSLIFFNGKKFKYCSHIPDDI